MNQLPPGQDRPEDADERYRRLSALDQSGPSEGTREAVLAYATQLARTRAQDKRMARAVGAPAQPPSGRAWRRVAAFGGLAAAALTAIVVVPRWSPPPPVIAAHLAPEPIAQATPSAPAPAPAQRSAERSYARAPPTSAPRQLQVQPGEAHARADAPAMSPLVARAGAARALRAEATDPGVALRSAASGGELATLETLLAQKPDLDGRDSHGQTALMRAVRAGRPAAVEMLLAHGADPNAADAGGTTPLAAAVAAPEPSIAETLRRYGAH